MKKLIHFVWLFAISAFVLHAQSDCGTIVTTKQVQLESTFVDSVSEIINLEKRIYLSAHIVKDESGGNGIDASTINSAIYNLNQVFDKIGLHFTLLNTTTIVDYNYNTVVYGNQDMKLSAFSSIDNTINLYFVNNLFSIADAQVSAYTFMPADNKDFIFFAKDSFNYVVLAEQIGHFFNLYHTHETVFGKELADQSNCNSAGDLCCDTYADPDLLGIVSEKCGYLGTAKDSQNNYYAPSVHNFMSSSVSACKCFFSDEQYIRMINAVLKLKTHLW